MSKPLSTFARTMRWIGLKIEAERIQIQNYASDVSPVEASHEVIVTIDGVDHFGKELKHQWRLPAAQFAKELEEIEPFE